MLVDTSVDGIVAIDEEIVIDYNMKVLTLNKKMNLHEARDLMLKITQIHEIPVVKKTKTSSNKNGATQIYDEYVLTNTWTLKENYETV